MKKKIILTVLLIGIFYRLALTMNGNFIFNIDNARDMVDIREMVVLKKLRLTGPNTPIPGVYDGPAWYYLLIIPFIITNGDPYGAIIMQIVLWAIGGFFLLKLTAKYGNLAVLTVGALWISSNFIVLAGVYSFNPNPVLFLTPLLIFLIAKYLTTAKTIFAILMWFLAGLFFNFEMNFGIFVPAIILASISFSRKISFLKTGGFWIGILVYFFCLLPQIIFDLRHDFIMLSGLIAHLKRETGTINPFSHFQTTTKSFYNVFVPTILNKNLLSAVLLVLFIPVLVRFFKQTSKDLIVIICLLYILIPFTGYLFLPVAVNPWHWGGEMAALLILISFMIKEIKQFNLTGKLTGVILAGIIIFFSIANILNFFIKDISKKNMDPSLYRNEIIAIDYVYKKAEGKNFKVYSYLPSIYDYPYQYLFWWYGKKTYGYIPGEYEYSPNKPQYISNKDKFEGEKENFSGLVFLIKEPDRINMRQAWENDFKNMQFISKEMVGPLEVEIRME